MFKMLTLLVLFLLDSTRAQHPCDDIAGDQSQWFSSAIPKEVVVVGGGAAGLAAMVELNKPEYDTFNDVILLEAQDYLGGRVKTHREDDILVEDGAEWMNGGKTNPLYEMAQDLNGLTQPVNDNKFDFRLLTSKGKKGIPKGYRVVNKVYKECEKNKILGKYKNVGYGQCYLDKYKKFSRKLRLKKQKAPWLHYLHMKVIKDTGTDDWQVQSARDADHFTDWGNDEWNQWKDGFETLTYYFLDQIPTSQIKTNSPVCKVVWDSVPNGKVLVVTKDGTSYLTDYIIMTASIGHLKERHQDLFSPQLPYFYRKNFENIYLGIANKVQLGWDTPWWHATKPLNIHLLYQKFNLPEEESWLYGIMEFLSIHQMDGMIQAFVAGKDAVTMENLPEETVKEHVVKLLKQVTKQNVPEPTFFRRSQWQANPWMYGSYNSYVTVDGYKNGLKNRKPLLKSIPNSDNKKVIFWAGEHTDTKRYGTVDGAMMSGRKAAWAVMDYYYEK